jgi:hypothetical protein
MACCIALTFRIKRARTGPSPQAAPPNWPEISQVRAPAPPVAPGGTLLAIARAPNESDPERDPGLMPWALTRPELDQAGGPLRPVSVEQFFDDEDPPKLRWRAEFQRD